MNNKEFITELSKRLDCSQKEATQLADATVTLIGQQLEEGKTVLVPGFGSFRVKKKMERVVVNPVTQQRLLIPPKLVLVYKSSHVLKNKFNS